MQNTTLSLLESVDKGVTIRLHDYQWLQNQQTITQKPHKITEKGEAYQVSGNLTIVRGKASVKPITFDMSTAFE